MCMLCVKDQLILLIILFLQNEVPTEQIEITEEDRINSPTEERMVDLTQRLEVAEEEAQRLSDTLEQMSAQKSALERDIAAMQSENEHFRANNETLNQEKWELSAANADLQNRLQAVSFMQASDLKRSALADP